MSDEIIGNFVEIFKALAHPVRLKMAIGLTNKEECNVSLMVAKLEIPQPSVSQHLNILKNAGVITGYKKGTQVCYKVTNDNVKKIVKALGVELCE